MSLYGEFVCKWRDGCGSPSCETATKVVLARGQIPCDILLTGEAPGESENVLGRPFCGPAGQLLDRIVAKALRDFPPLRLAFTNLVGCIPREDDGGKSTEPSVESIMTCADRLQEFIDLCRPSLVVCVGSLSRNWLRQGYKNPVKLHPSVKVIDITHPAAILRANIAARSLMEQRCVVTLRGAIDDLVNYSPIDEKG